MPSRLGDETTREHVCVFELPASELCRTLFERRIQLEPLLSSEIVLIREQYFDADALGQLYRFVEDDLSILDVSP